MDTSRDGIKDLAGNVSEIVLGKPKPPPKDVAYVWGADYLQDDPDWLVVWAGFATTDLGLMSLGFRCASDAEGGGAG